MEKKAFFIAVSEENDYLNNSLNLDWDAFRLRLVETQKDVEALRCWFNLETLKIDSIAEAQALFQESMTGLTTRPEKRLVAFLVSNSLTASGNLEVCDYKTIRG